MGLELVIDGVSRSVGGQLWGEVSKVIDAQYSSNSDSGVSFVYGEQKYNLFECDNELVLSVNCRTSLSHITDFYGTDVDSVLLSAGLL
ncbi:hypothetical protein PQC39_gp100 [Vibrio phage Vp_R1]|uniref:Uncharacterized protein n=1 Tax=Vibrio phage Vp_R1 TaxID=2059867 RepID=A0A2H5BQ57_9CAUD|nr:hypothetical protein PQC39_gp100 [Vibrio phage Vp_R1]AUG88464.1 hypothetical protein VPR_100 [Vibrio phage Vp_R1]